MRAPAPRTMTPRLDVLPAAQRRLWSRLTGLPAGTVLYGGTAIALHLGHRQSIDFDFFIGADIDPDGLLTGVPFLRSARVARVDVNTLICVVGRNDPVQVSFFGTPRLRRVRPPIELPGKSFGIADLLDLAATKVAVIQKRAEAKDYIDLDALLLAGVRLPKMLAAAKAIYGRAFEPLVSLKALGYFEEGNLSDVPRDARARLVGAVRDVDIAQIPRIRALNNRRQ